MEIRLKPIISRRRRRRRSYSLLLSSSRFTLAHSAFCRARSSSIAPASNRHLSIESLITKITNIPPKQIEIQSRISANLLWEAKVNVPLIFSVEKRRDPPVGRVLRVISEVACGENAQLASLQRGEEEIREFSKSKVFEDVFSCVRA